MADSFSSPVYSGTRWSQLSAWEMKNRSAFQSAKRFRSTDETGLLQKMRTLIRLRHYSYRTEQTYLDWVKRYLHYAREHGVDFRSTDGVRSYLSYLATARNVSASTQNQAFNALLFLNREVLGLTMESVKAIRAKRGPKLPVVLTPDEVKRVFANTEAGTKRLVLQLIYGAGLRV